VKAFNRRLFAALVMAGMLGFAGCGPDNETEGQKLSTKLGDPGKVNPDVVPKDKVTPPSTSADRAKVGPTGTQKQMEKGGYPTGK
jgi:hypothetical protein